METYTRSDLLRGLAEAGLAPGDLVFFQSRLFGLGRPEEVSGKAELCGLFLDALLEAIGPEGTLVVPTFSTQVARHNAPFIVEETAPNYGLFPEYVCRHPDFVRSRHPLWSVAASGRLKDEICRGGGVSNFGVGSPFDAMVRYGAKNVFCGLEVRDAATIIHYMEMHYGVPYVYNKLLKWRPIEKGVASDRAYLACVRYLEDTVGQDLGRFERDLFERGKVRSARVGGGQIHALDTADMLEVGYAGLHRDPYYFLPGPPEFDYGRPPYDGPSLARESTGRTADRAELAAAWLGLSGDQPALLAEVTADDCWRLLRFARNEFFAPFCLGSPLCADISACGWTALLALQLGAERVVACGARADLARVRALLESQGVPADKWEAKPAEPGGKLPLEAGSVRTLAAVGTAGGGGGGRLAEIARVLARGGVALVSAAESLAEKAAAAGLTVEREMAGGEAGWAAVLRKPADG